MAKSIFGLTVLVSVLLISSTLIQSNAETARKDWTAEELSAYLLFLQDGHEGISGSQIVSLQRSEVPEDLIQKALTHKKNAEQSIKDSIEALKELEKKFPIK